MKDFLNAISLLPDKYKDILKQIPEKTAVTVKEIRFRNGEPVILNTQDTVYYIRNNGTLTVSFSSGLLCVNEKDLQEIV